MSKPKTNFFITIIFIVLNILCSAQSYSTDKAIIAVHNFNVSPALQKLKINGWWISEMMENELVQTGKCRVVTRARISRVLNEKNISTGSTLEPKALGKIIGADYIVTGQAEFSANKLIVTANLINVTHKTGEIVESYDVSGISQPEHVAAKLTELVKELAIMLNLSPGEFLDRGLAFMKSGNYNKAVEMFKFFERDAKLAKIVALIKMVDKKHLEREAATIDLSNKTSGEALDYGLELMRRGELNQAALVFYQLQNSHMAKKIKNLMQLAKAGAKKQAEKINLVIASARLKFKNAIINRNKAEQQKSPATLCDAAISELQTFLNAPKFFLSADERTQIEQLINKIEQFRKKLFNGPSNNTKWLIPQVNITLIPIKPGKFKMQNALPAEDRDEPEYSVTLTQPFWIGKTEITAGTFLYYLKSLNFKSKAERYTVDREINFSSKFCPINSHYRLRRGFTKQHPMSEISWRGAVQFCRWLNAKEQAAGRLPAGYEYRLPTEAEWEYCCRAGVATAFSFGNNTGKADQYAWYRSNSGRQSHKCGSKRPNSWGIYDMHGNVWEWCNDWYEDTFLIADCENPIGPDASNENSKVVRGGSFTSSPLDLRCGTRYSYDYKRGKKNIGFRIVCAPEL